MSIPPKEDPWEARERERERWRNAAKHPRRSSPLGASLTGAEGATGPINFGEDLVVWGLLVAVAALLLSEVPAVAESLRPLLARGATLILLLLVGVARVSFDDWRGALRGAGPALILLLGWTVLEFVRVPAPFRGYSLLELMRVVDGIAAYVLCSFCLRVPRQTGIVVAGLIMMGVLLSLCDISLVGQRGGMSENVGLHESVIGTHENSGSLIMLLLAPALAFGISGAIEEKRRLASAAGALILGVALILARTRSAWMGGFVALLVLAILAIRFPNGDAGPTSRRRPREGLLSRLIGSPATIIAAAMFTFLITMGAASLIMRRAVLKDDSMAVRLTMWSGASRMAAERPIFGWGLGAYPVIQSQWTHSGMNVEEALQRSVGHENLAHDYYMQWGADNGAVGLFLYVFVVVFILITACTALRDTTSAPRRALLCGGIATIAGVLVDAIASPSYQYRGISTVFWCIAGLTAASARPDGKSTARAAPASGPPLAKTALTYAGSAVAGLCVAFGVIGIGRAIVARGAVAPHATLEIASLTPGGAVEPGQPARWVAIFHDDSGHDQDTASGAIWWPSGTSLAMTSTRAWHATADEAVREGVRHGIIQIITPELSGANKGTLTMRVMYRDRYSRWYTAYSTIEVRAAQRRKK